MALRDNTSNKEDSTQQAIDGLVNDLVEKRIKAQTYCNEKQAQLEAVLQEITLLEAKVTKLESECLEAERENAKL
jgi:hypothetical protein